MCSTICYSDRLLLFLYTESVKTKEVDYDTQGWHILAPNSLGIIFLFISGLQLLSAQEDSARFTLDSMLIKPKAAFQLPSVNLLPEKTVYPLINPIQLGDLPSFSLKEELRIPYHINPSPLFRGDYSTGGVLRQFPHGAVFGSGSQTSVPGIGRFNNASLGYQHIFNDRLSLQLRANAMKINMSHITGQAFSTAGRLTYRASDRVAFNVFGSYDIGNSYGMSTNSYGATMSLDMSERFGMEVGAQRYYDAMRGGWQTVPVVIPYYRFEKFKLGLDVGGIMYEILRNVVFDKRGGGDFGGGPTIRPPKFSFPIK